MKNKILLSSASIIVLALESLGNVAVAQEVTERPASIREIFDEVTVTATKKTDAENVQDVPISVTAFNGKTLEALKVRTLESLSFSAPNVTLDEVGTTRGTANFSIRGLGVNSSIPSIDPTVGVFVDGVYLGLNSGVVFDLFDLDSVEVLRGPQGLLFGRNTTGGALLLNTGNPTDEFSYKFRAAVESPVDSDRGGVNTFLQGTVSGPLVEGKLNGKIGAYFNNDDGYFVNQFNGENHGKAETTILRGALEWLPSEDLTVLAKLEHFDSSGDGPSGQNRGVFERDTFDISIDEEGAYASETLFGTIKADLDVDFGAGTITNIFGYRETEAETLGDIDSLPFFGFHSSTELKQDQISNELRYSGTFGKAEVTTGVYYFDQDVAYTEVRDLPPLSPLTFYGGGTQEHTVYGIFGQVDYNFSDKFVGIFGLRYSKEEKNATVTYIRPRPACSVVGGTCPITGTNPIIPTENNGFQDSNDWSNVTPKIGFQYLASDNSQIYGNYTKGFRSGGYNFRITAPAPFEAIFPVGGPRSFDEEKVNSFELGAKMQTSDKRGTLNTSIFLTDISDMQREVNVSDPNAGVVQTIVNTADATLKGLEVEGRYAFTDNFIVTGNIGLIDDDYDELRFDLSGDGAINNADLDLRIPRVPKSTFGFGFIHQTDLGTTGSITTRANFQHRDRIAYTDNNFGWIQAADMLSGNITWNTPVNGLAVSLYGKNLLDEVQAGGDTQLPFGGTLSNGINAPFDAYPAAGTLSPLKKGRVIGLELTLRR